MKALQTENNVVSSTDDFKFKAREEFSGVTISDNLSHSLSPLKRPIISQPFLDGGGEEEDERAERAVLLKKFTIDSIEGEERQRTNEERKARNPIGLIGRCVLCCGGIPGCPSIHPVA